MTTTWIWISGWAIYPDRFRSAVELAFPDYSHKVLAPTPDALEVVLKSKADRIGGYSLGSLILLSALQQIPETTQVTCLSPFIAFCKEDQLGGTTPRATLRSLQQRLHKQPEKALQLFYRLAGLDEKLMNGLPYSVKHLEWGLEQLINLKADTAYLNRATAVIGSKDPLINHQEIRSIWPACHFLDTYDHDYRKLLAALNANKKLF